MKCYIIKSNLLTEPLKAYTCNLPLFANEFPFRTKGFSEYIAFFTKPDRYSMDDIYICPHEINSKLVNNAWNYCVENNLDSYQFEIDE